MVNTRLNSSLCVTNANESSSNLSLPQKRDFQRIIDNFSLIALEDLLSLSHLITRTIDTGVSKSIAQRQYRLYPVSARRSQQGNLCNIAVKVCRTFMVGKFCLQQNFMYIL